MRDFVPAHGSAGFTLIELIAVLILTAILSIAVVPRLAERRTFDTLGYADSLSAMLHHARRVAVAQRRTVCVGLAEATLSFAQSSKNGASSCDQSLPDPAGNGPLAIVVPDGASLLMEPAQFSFDGLGRPSSAVTFTIAGDITRTISIEADSGYVHSP